MKKLFSKPASLLKYVATFSVAFVLLASIITIFFGFNKSVNFGDAYEVRIKLMNGQDDYKTYLETSETVLDTYGYSVSEAKLESSTYDYSLLIRFKAEKTNKTDNIVNDIATTLNIKESSISINQIKTTNLVYFWTNLLIILGVILVLIFIYGLIRKDWVLATTYTLQYLFNILISLGIICASRLEVSLTTLNIISIFALVSVLMTLYIVNRSETIKERAHNENKKLSDIFAKVVSDNKFTALIFAIVFVGIFAGLLVTKDWALIFASITGVVSLLVSLLSTIFFACPLYLTFREFEENKIKEVMSRNNLEENSKKMETKKTKVKK